MAINAMAKEAAKLTTKEAQALDKEAHQLIDRAEESYFTLGGVLSKIARTGCFTDLGADHFNQYVEEQLSFALRKAYYLIKIYEKAQELGVNEARLVKIGWTKVREVLAVADALTLEDWISKAETMTLQRLLDEIKAFKSGGAVKVTSTDEDGNRTITGDVETYKELVIPLSKEQYANVKLALNHASKVAESEKQGHLIDLICMSYLAQTGADIENFDELIAEFVNRGFIEIGPDDGEEEST